MIRIACSIIGLAGPAVRVAACFVYPGHEAACLAGPSLRLARLFAGAGRYRLVSGCKQSQGGWVSDLS